MSDGDRLILIETWTDFSSGYNLGLKSLFRGDDNAYTAEKVEIKDIEMSNFIFTAPRVVQICFNDTPDDKSKEKC